MTPTNLLGPPPLELPVDPAAAELAAGVGVDAVARDHPESSLVWAVLAERALDEGADLQAYAFARVGYHRGLDLLRRSGWRGAGLVPWSHEPNRGFLRSLSALSQAAALIDETDEVTRIREFLRACDPDLPADVVVA